MSIRETRIIYTCALGKFYMGVEAHIGSEARHQRLTNITAGELASREPVQILDLCYRALSR